MGKLSLHHKREYFSKGVGNKSLDHDIFESNPNGGDGFFLLFNLKLMIMSKGHWSTMRSNYFSQIFQGNTKVTSFVRLRI